MTASGRRIRELNGMLNVCMRLEGEGRKAWRLCTWMWRGQNEVAGLWSMSGEGGVSLLSEY